jgi:uncharacterized protein (DUF305 family)
MQTKHRLVLHSALLLLTLFLSACGGDEAGAPASSAAPEPSMESGADSASETMADVALNEADLTFLQSMIPHHDQANAMASYAAGRTERPEVEEFAAGILDKQSAEIQEMQDLLRAAGEDPEGMTGMGHGDMDMPGMMDETQIAQLEELQGQEFDLAFVQMITEHHQGAIEMAETVLAEGENSQVEELANRIIEDQQAEIERMGQWQEEWS